ncbi:oligopeptide/dipeptide ABC transporter ATP-binding protein [Petropleomorpha daqingensis]|uniref:Peptide/nickel transport system ATP-binding protein n=1 Tax=Petropleomorpha daqingensis TaxID=2026353 RepID=A0A853CLS1_9ACTN|nr:oligopeptide/dipeptide ABC transporter ATP-binding protein [Petropleomorpha daqingensis]NYJ07208.1 peptide/nickel transport system ATP-binding protein [Petropleomorpha daqingensis]
MSAAQQTAPLLAVTDLHVRYKLPGWRTPPVKAVDGVSFTMAAHETVGLVGESGSGKSTIGRALLGLAPVSDGRIVLDGHDITHSKAGERRHIASDLQVVFQDPYGSLNPARTVGRTLAEPLEAAGELDRSAALERIREVLTKVRLPEDAADRYPNAFSGGQRQRIAIARALAVNPRLVVCDEAISALDVVTQAQVLNLLAELQRETGVGYLFIAHNLPVVSYFSDRVLVLYRGRIMESGPAAAIHDRPAHPYTQALRAAVPVPDAAQQRILRRQRQAVVRATTAQAKPAPAEGCPFAPRCPHVADVCWNKRPIDAPFEDRTVACHVFDPSSGHPQAGNAAAQAAGELAPTTR